MACSQASRRLAQQLFGSTNRSSCLSLAERGSTSGAWSLHSLWPTTPAHVSGRSEEECKQREKQQQSNAINFVDTLGKLHPKSRTTWASLQPAQQAPSAMTAPGLYRRSTPGAIGLPRRAPLGLGSVSGCFSSPFALAGAATPARGYLTEGQLLGHAFQLTTDIMFWSGLLGAVVFRRNLIVMLLATEIVMLACNLNFLFASAYLNDMTGVIMSITITTIAACETAIGLALCVTYFHLRSATDVEALNLLK